MIAALKRSSLTISKQIGLSGLLAQSEWRRRRLLVVAYHGVTHADEHHWDPALYVSAAHLERRLELLRHHRCAVLPLGEAVERLYRDELPDRAVVLTFDDGYDDFRANAWPLLRAYEYPATVYLTTGRVDHNFPVVNLLISYLLWRARAQVLDGRGLPGLRGDYLLATPEERQRVVTLMDAAIQSGTRYACEKDDIACALATRLGLSYESLRERRTLTLLRPSDVTQLSREGVDFQLHTHRHRTPEDAEAFIRDLQDNRRRISELTGIRPDHLCYPSGNYRPRYLRPLRRAGIISGTTCDPGIAGRRTEPLLLPRLVDTSVLPEIEFEGWITGVASYLPRRSTRAPSMLDRAMVAIKQLETAAGGCVPPPSTR
jgi:peptidoglycan/xylan/chitin deacetylase (PgdA/CDA1 family)